MPPSSRFKPGRAEAFHAPEVVHFDPSESDHRWCTLGDRGHYDGDGAEFEAFGHVHGGDGDVSGFGFDMRVEDGEWQGGGEAGVPCPVELGVRADKDADLMCEDT